jgi:hypothetical protein
MHSIAKKYIEENEHVLVSGRREFGGRQPQPLPALDLHRRPVRERPIAALREHPRPGLVVAARVLPRGRSLDRSATLPPPYDTRVEG